MNIIKTEKNLYCKFDPMIISWPNEIQNWDEILFIEINNLYLIYDNI